MASENDQTTPDTTADAVLAVEVSPVAPAEKPKRRRATKKAAAPAAEPDAGAVPDEAAPAGTDDDPAQTPAQKATRKRAAATAPAQAAKTAKTAKAAKTTTKRAKKSVAAAEPEVVEDPAGEVVEEEVVADPEVDETPAAAVPSFGLLFQPPEPVAPRRRRATAPAQAPAERPAEEEETAAEVGTAAEPAQPTDATEDTTEHTAEDATEQARGGRRSRGGRGGRGSRSTRAQGNDTSDTTDTTDTATDEPADQEADRGSDDRATDEGEGGSRSRRRRGGRGRRGRSQSDDEGTASETAGEAGDEAGGTGPDEQGDDGEGGTSRRRRRRRRGAGSGDGESDDPPGTVTRVREPRSQRDEPTAVKGSTRLEAKKQRRREGREAGRRRTIITEAEFLARRESVERVMVVRGRGDRTQIGVLEDGVLVEHYVSRETTASMAGNVYLGRVQNVLPSMEAAFVDIGKGRNAVLYAGEVNWDAAGLEGGQARRIENALSSGDTVLTQVTKDPIGHKGARLTSQISLPGRYLVYVPEGQMTGISRKLPDTERARLKAILKEVVPDHAGVIVRTAAEGASEEELRADVERLTKIWDKITAKAESAGAKKAGSGGAPALLHGEPDLTVRVIRDVFTEDFTSLVISGEKAWGEVSQYVEDVAPDLAPRLQRWTAEEDVFAAHRIDEALAKAMDRKVWLPSGGSLVIDRTEAMTVVDVNTGKFVGSGGNLEETVTKNNLEAAEEIVRQLRLRDIGGIIVIDFIDMVLESNRDLVVRRLLECLGRDRTKHQVAEVTSLGLVQMTRKRVGSGLVEVFSEQCEHCGGRGILVHTEPIDRSGSSGEQGSQGGGQGGARSGRGRRGSSTGTAQPGGSTGHGADEAHKPSGPTAAQIAAAAHAAALRRSEVGEGVTDLSTDVGDAVADELAAVAATTFGGPVDAETGPVEAHETDETVEPSAPEVDLALAGPTADAE
ncbi:MAG TPA: Rne/Rng family ribonuclease, partial [Ornithinibacter sp.]|nr:Rne/Rng family ribonuclease [Ornithinibacter sp.]